MASADSPEIITTAALRRAGVTAPGIDSHVRQGDLVSVHRGVYAPKDAWDSAGSTGQFVARVRAQAEVSAAPPLLSHFAAAAVHGLPSMFPWPNRVDVLTPGAAGGSSSRHLRTHREERPVETVIVDGLNVTSLASTLADIAIDAPAETSVPMLDCALHRAARASAVDQEGGAEALRAAVMAARDLRAPSRGARRADWAIEFASRHAESPGESLSRVLIHRGGFVAPDLQCEIRVDSRRFRVDFAWPEVFGEFDGRIKYSSEEMLRGRTSAEAVRDEKRREDAIRLSTGRRFVRWGIEELRAPRRLWDLLEAGRVPRDRPALPLRARAKSPGTRS